MRSFEQPAAEPPRSTEQEERLAQIVADVERRLASPNPPKTVAYAIWAALDAKGIKHSEARTLWFARVMGARAERKRVEPQGIVAEHPGILDDAAAHEQQYGPGEDERLDEAA